MFTRLMATEPYARYDLSPFPTPKTVDEDPQRGELRGRVQDSWSVQRFSHYIEVTAEGEKTAWKALNCSPPILTP